MTAWDEVGGDADGGAGFLVPFRFLAFDGLDVIADGKVVGGFGGFFDAFAELFQPFWCIAVWVDVVDWVVFRIEIAVE
ncbi:hypothetical protein [Cytobacillus horneckiae]|uniref:hypothetical protein n=1 Tax=Cytobacillus horneckiae TaxID=549687 RepID=UPI003D9A9169